MRKTSLVLALMAACLTNGCAETARAAEPTEDQRAVGVANVDGPVATALDALCTTAVSGHRTKKDCC